MKLNLSILVTNFMVIAAAALAQSRQWSINAESMTSSQSPSDHYQTHDNVVERSSQLHNQMKHHHQLQMKQSQNNYNIDHLNQINNINEHHQQPTNFLVNNNNKLSLQNAHQHQQATLFALNKKQHELIKSNPGSFQAVARAFKMAIQECKYQMRDEPWNCTVSSTNLFSIKPAEIFGSLMSRSFKETSFIQSLISAAIAHSITRACTESTISTCSKKQTRYNNGFSEDIEFGGQFAKRFMELNHELPVGSNYDSYNYNLHSSSKAAGLLNSINYQASSSSALKDNNNVEQQNLIQAAISTSGGLSTNSIDPQHQPIWKERKFRHMINAHNDEVGRLRVLDGMRKECKCHGLSGTCTMQTCWLKLPPFREVANRLHESLDQALRVELTVAQNSHYGPMAASRYKSLTSAAASTTSTKKSNKKRSSSSMQSASILNGLGRSPVSQLTTKSSHSMMGDFGAEGGGGGGASVNGGVGGRLQAFHESPSSINNMNVGGGGGAVVNSNDNPNGIVDGQSMREFIATTNNHLNRASQQHQQQQFMKSPPPQPVNNNYNPNQSSNSTAVKKRPVARSIAIAASTLSPPSKFDLLYAEESPDFCVPSERYNIKGTKGRQCSENEEANNSCKKLCCGRGYITELREEQYKCECKFEFCCKLDCKICKRKKKLHKCL